MKKSLLISFLVILIFSSIACVDYASLDEAKAKQALSEDVVDQNEQMLLESFDTIQKLTDDVDMRKKENDQLIADNAALNDLLTSKDLELKEFKDKADTAKSEITADQAVREELFDFLSRDLASKNKAEFVYAKMDTINYSSINPHTLTFDRMQVGKENAQGELTFTNRAVKLETMVISNQVIIKKEDQNFVGLNEESNHLLIDYIYIDSEIEVMDNFPWYAGEPNTEDNEKIHVICFKDEEVVMIIER